MRAELYWIDGPWRGRLAILPRPRGGEWLPDEIDDWKAAGLQVILSLLTSEEMAELDLQRESQLCQAAGLEYLSFPIPDRDIPASTRTTSQIAQAIGQRLAAGQNVGLHCRAGIGRSAVMAAVLLAMSGLDVESAFNRISAARRCPVPDPAEQRNWVAEFARKHALPAASTARS